MSFTEGPYSQDPVNPNHIMRGNMDKAHLWRIATVNKKFPNWEHNARLLAASWEMHEILKDVEEKLNGNSQLLEALTDETRGFTPIGLLNAAESDRALCSRIKQLRDFLGGGG